MDEVKNTLTEDELLVLNLLASAWNKFLNIPVAHHSDAQEFMQAIHTAQNIILARVGMRALKEIEKQQQDDNP